MPKQYCQQVTATEFSKIYIQELRSFWTTSITTGKNGFQNHKDQETTYGDKVAVLARPTQTMHKEALIKVLDSEHLLEVVLDLEETEQISIHVTIIIYFG